MTSAQIHHRRRLTEPRRGLIFVTALLVIVILTAMLLVFGQEMRTEALAAATRVSYAQADAVELGAEQYVLAAAESARGDAITVTSFPAEAIPVGQGYFWILSPDPDTDQQYNYGIVDEAGKVNINSVTPDDPTKVGLINLPGMTEEVAEAMTDWQRDGSNPQPNGAESDYYEGLPEAYDAKNNRFETVEELYLVKNDVGYQQSDQRWDQLLFGLDANRDGVVDAAERNNGGNMGFSAGGNADRGFFNDITVYSRELNQALDGTSRTNVVQSSSFTIPPPPWKNGPPLSPFQSLMNQMNIPGADQNSIMKQIAVAINPPPAPPATVITRNNVAYILSRGVPQRTPFSDLLTFYFESGMYPTYSQDFDLIADYLSTSGKPNIRGLINVNTAPEEVLECLPGLSQSDADSLISTRQGQDSNNIGWVANAMTTDKAEAIGPYITARSFQYSADIVAVSGDGKAFKRVRIVVDCRTVPASIIYRRDLTSYGWPLPEQIRTALRAGQPIPTGNGNGTSSISASHF